jgi:putative ABC transport system ATP-binding protein
VPQEPDLSDMKAEGVLHECFDYKANHDSKGNLGNVPKLLERFGLPQEILKQQTRELSGGEKQRLVMIAAVLLDRPLILLDEASSALDPESGRLAIDYFRSRDDLSILAVSHDREWEGLADTVVDLGNGGAAK